MSDACRRCGENIRSSRHFNAGESQTDVARARAAIAKAQGGAA